MITLPAAEGFQRAVFHPEASQEYLEAIQYYAAIGVELGERFDAEIQRLVGAVSRDPQRFFRFHPPAQRDMSSEFPYSVVCLQRPSKSRRPQWYARAIHQAQFGTVGAC